MTILIFLIVLVFLILAHELGHFLVAKKAGVRVDEFGIGFPPRLWSFKKGETVYSLNLIPFGGFVRIYGETPGETILSGPDRERSLVGQPRKVQAAVLVGGVVFNFLLAWFLLSLGLLGGLPTSVSAWPAGPKIDQAKLLIVNVLPGSPAAQAGLQIGDEITYLAEADGSLVIKDGLKPETVQSFSAARPGQKIIIGYRRGAIFQSVKDQGREIKEAMVIPERGLVPERAAVGISLDQVGLLKLPLIKAVLYGGELTGRLTLLTLRGLFDLIAQALRGEAAFRMIIGPVGLAGLVGDAADLGLVYLLSLTAFISINLAIINLVPFPALDGGRLLFLAVEAVKGSPIKPVIVNALNLLGLVLLLLLMTAVTYGDLARLFSAAY